MSDVATRAVTGSGSSSSGPDELAGVVVAAGAGSRLGGTEPKSLRELGGRPLVVHAVDCLLRGGAASVVVVAAAAEVKRFSRVLHRFGMDVPVVAGGAERQESVVAGLVHVPAASRWVLVHDAARPLVPDAVVERVVDALRAGATVVVPAVPVVDTIRLLSGAGSTAGSGAGSTVLDRTLLRAVQTPQGFDRAVLDEAHRTAAEHDWRATDDAALCERLGSEVVLVPGDRASLKITEAVDLLLAEALISS